MPEKIWFITGASRGFGRIWAEAALERGDKVAASARGVDDVADLKTRYGNSVLPLALDVTNADQVRQAVQQAHDHFGRLDIVLNNAGYALVGTIEEAAEADVRALFETNYFGALRIIQAALPLLRKQGHGHLLTVSSSVGIVPMPLIGYYCSSKAAIEALHESLAPEVAPFGIKVTLIEPGAYATTFTSGESLKMAPGLDAYAELREKVRAGLSNAQRGDPKATAAAILAVVDAQEPPLRFILGNETLPIARSAYASRLATWETWAAVSNAAQGAPESAAVVAP
jgi:NAD(P)-dependent dehydrogenase (short-subunit alcohol dehydrogenase family)